VAEGDIVLDGVLDGLELCEGFKVSDGTFDGSLDGILVGKLVGRFVGFLGAFVVFDFLFFPLFCALPLLLELFDVELLELFDDELLELVDGLFCAFPLLLVLVEFGCLDFAPFCAFPLVLAYSVLDVLYPFELFPLFTCWKLLLYTPIPIDSPTSSCTCSII